MCTVTSSVAVVVCDQMCICQILFLHFTLDHALQMSTEAGKIMPQINKSLARMVADSLEETCGFWTHLNFWTFSGLADQSQFSMWLHQSSCKHSTLDVWTCLASGSESSGPSQITGCHRSLGTGELEESLFTACKHKTSAWDKVIYYLLILGNYINADRLLLRMKISVLLF